MSKKYQFKSNNVTAKTPNPVTPISDQDRISPYKINTISC